MTAISTKNRAYCMFSHKIKIKNYSRYLYTSDVFFFFCEYFMPFNFTHNGSLKLSFILNWLH